MVVLAPTPSVDDSYMFKKVHVVDPESGRIIRSLGNPGKLGQVAWSPDGSRLATGSADRTSRIWPAGDTTYPPRLTGDGGRVWSVVWSPD